LLARTRRENLDTLLEGTGPDNNSHFSLWRLTRGIKRQPLFQSPVQSHSGLWLKTDDEKARAFASHLTSTFIPFNLTDDSNHVAIINFLDTPTAPARPIRHTTPHEVKMQLKALQIKKTPG